MNKSYVIEEIPQNTKKIYRRFKRKSVLRETEKKPNLIRRYSLNTNTIIKNELINSLAMVNNTLIKYKINEMNQLANEINSQPFELIPNVPMKDSDILDALLAENNLI